MGKDAANASARRLGKEDELKAINNGVAVLATDERTDRHRAIAVAVTEFLQGIKRKKA